MGRFPETYKDPIFQTNTTQTLAGESPLRTSLTYPPLMCSTAASIEDKKNLRGKKQ